VASGAKTDRAQLRKAIAALDAGDVLMVTRLDRLARSTRDLLNTLAAITDHRAGFRSLGDAWAAADADRARRTGGIRARSDPSLADIGRSYNVSSATISRLVPVRG
jgi:DNA invertase Pin-like site-specific DNA recombinase